MNGYFQVYINDKGTGITLFPPTPGGDKIQVAELRDYLGRVGIPFDVTALNKALFDLEDEPVDLFLSPNRIPPVDEKCDVQVMADRMSAVMRVYPNSVDGRTLSKEKILEYIKDARIKSGIDESAIDRFLSEKNYCSDIIVAKGALPTPGQDAKIIYNFDTNNQARPELNEDGSVDFFKLNLLHHCSKGQVLAQLIPAKKGENGLDVMGNTILARDVKTAKFDHGRNIEISSDGLKLISQVDGNVSCINGAVFVTDVYEIENVGPSTGNIDYPGNVNVKGNVCENFEIRCDGNVYVNGVVEGATIEAKGDIIITRGMHGQSKGKLVAGGNIISKFISAADVSAGGYVEAEQILNSTVTAGTEVNAEAGKGLIAGGKISANKAVNVKNCGTNMGAATVVEVGCDPELKKKSALLQKDAVEKTKNINQIKTSLATITQRLQKGAKLTPEQILNVKNMQKLLHSEQEQLDKISEELSELSVSVDLDDNAHIDVSGTMYQGVAITISGVNMAIKKDYQYCRLIKDGADIVSRNL